MSLDTVELVMDIENHFYLRIPDPEVEKIHTVQHFVDCIFSKIILNPGQKCKSQILFYRVRAFFVDHLNIVREDCLRDTKLKELIPDDQLNVTWEELGKSMDVKLPSLSPLDIDPAQEKDLRFFGIKIGERKKPLSEGTVEDLIDWIFALNYEKFIDPKNLCSKYDVERIIMGIISDRVGMDIDEINLSHSITNDLGID